MFPRVKEILKASEGGIEGVKLYFAQEGMEVDPSTWCGNIKKAVDKGHTLSVLAEIDLIKIKFNFYEDVSKEKEGTGIDSVDGEGHTESEG